MADIDLDELAGELSEFDRSEKQACRSPREERIIAGFEEIQRFIDEHGRLPEHGDDRDIFERLYAVRLDRLRALEECRAVLAPPDHRGLLQGGAFSCSEAEKIEADELAAELAELEAETGGIAELRHVRSTAEKRAAEEIANRQACADFGRFKGIFEKVQQELDAGIRQTRPFERKAEIEQGRLFIVGGQKAYVAEKEEEFTQSYGDRDARLRVIFDNGTESNMLMRSLQRALNDDDTGRRITDPSAGPLFGDQSEESDTETGTIYVLRSRSQHPEVARHRDLLHKIGVTGGSVERRVANARLSTTYLMAEVEIVATYDLFNINRTKLENLLHRILAPARMGIEIRDRFGNPVTAREWFLVPLFVIDEVVEKIRDGSIAKFAYDPKSAALVPR